MKRIFFIALLILTCSLKQLEAQSIVVSGQIYGFTSDKVLLLKKASKNLGFEGPLDKVQVRVMHNGKEITARTDNNGFYTLVLPNSGDLDMKVVKDGFSSISVKLIIKEAVKKSRYAFFNFILKKDNNSINELGEIVFDPSGVLKHQHRDGNKSENHDVIQSNKILIEKCIEFNNGNKFADVPVVAEVKGQVKGKVVAEPKSVETKPSLDSVRSVFSDRIKALSDLVMASDKVGVDGYRDQIEKLKNELNTIGLTAEEIEYLKQQINDAELKLKLKEELILSQEKGLKDAKRIILFMLLFVIVLVVSILLGLIYLKQRKKYNLDLRLKNIEITKVNQRLISSIKYASVIQSNILSSKQDLSKCFPDSFVFNKPKDYLSGDFFWCLEKDGDVILALADCTGHGVPGALLSILGQRFLQETLEQEGTVSPKAIISELDRKFVNAFKDQGSVEYGVELGVIRYVKREGKLYFSSNGIGMYLQSKGQLNYILPEITPREGDKLASDANEMVFDVVKGNCVILSSDGFADQFGKTDGKTKKFNTRAMTELLRGNLTDDISKLAVGLEHAHTEWKGELTQTDDILVLGVKL